MVDINSEKERGVPPTIIEGDDPLHFFFKAVAVVVLLAIGAFLLMRWMWRLVFG